MSDKQSGAERAVRGSEPEIAVGLLTDMDELDVDLRTSFIDAGGEVFAPGSYRVTPDEGGLRVVGPKRAEATAVSLRPRDPERGRFSVEATIGVEFHWEQQEEQVFRGGLRLLTRDERLTLINDVALEAYLTSVICSEMNAASPPALLRAHAVISRSWLLAQVRAVLPPARPSEEPGTHLRWYDRDAHQGFDVCADDHCQRYQGEARVDSTEVATAVAETRGQVLTHGGEVCDARFSKCCGGVTEDFRAGWQDLTVPYLTPVTDAADRTLPSPPLTDEEALQAYVREPPTAWCNCQDADLLRTLLPAYDQATVDFLRWRVRLTAEEATRLLADKGNIKIGRLLALEPVERGLSGRLIRLRLEGETATLVIGKELEIRRLLSPSHLYSSAFFVETEGPAERPEAFILHGAGWGHGVGLCQIGAAVMAAQGHSHDQILAHYYPGATLENWYE